MPHLPFSIELHDSDVTSIVLDNGAATVKLGNVCVVRGRSAEAVLIGTPLFIEDVSGRL
jgi:hypothetical protein